MALMELVVEDAALAWLNNLGYAVANAPHLAPGEIAADRKHGYPPNLHDKATKLVLQQAELLCAGWAA